MTSKKGFRGINNNNKGTRLRYKLPNGANKKTGSETGTTMMDFVTKKKLVTKADTGKSKHHHTPPTPEEKRPMKKTHFTKKPRVIINLEDPKKKEGKNNDNDDDDENSDSGLICSF